MFTRSRRVQQSTPAVVASLEPVNSDSGAINAYVLHEETSVTPLTVVVSANQEKPVVISSKPRPPTSLDLLRAASPDELAPDTPTITKILLSTLDGVQCGVPTLTTPTLTPTTLRNIQQTFLQASASPHSASSASPSAASQVQPPEDHSHQAGFVPPIVHPQPGSTFISIDSKSLGGGIATLVDTSSTAPLPPASSTTFTQLPLPPPSTSSSTVSSTTTGPPPALLPISGLLTSAPSAPLPGPSDAPLIPPPKGSASPPLMPSVAISVTGTDQDTSMMLNMETQAPAVPQGRRMGGRRPNNRYEKLSDEEEQKRIIRRERNKMAAARCRKRRLDQTNTLQDETDKLEAKKSELQSEIQVLKQQKDELEFLLKHHKRDCNRNIVPSSLSLPVHSSSSSSFSELAPKNPAKMMKTTQLVGKKLPAIKREQHSMTPPPPSYSPRVTVKEESVSDSEEYNPPHIPASLSSLPLPRMGGQPMTRPSLLLGSTHNATASTYLKDNKVVTIYTTSSSSSSSSPSSGSNKPNRPTTLNVGPLTDIGVSIETPSTGLRGFNFDSMMDGGTGLTPMTPMAGSMVSLATGLTPLSTPIVAHPGASVTSTSSLVVTSNQCAQQVVSSASDMSSPDSIGPKQLVSL